ncbi:translation initiation factor IF-3 [Coxiella endosymbiont of Amblyomma americanum]|nr:translation initiation factor IF-3 [Coxiella endosymbiont of Amblyomma americanum]AUJ58687.1 translation initiation factor IF-3 [Coxiella-like endosymbiont of Amblyomma americanum]
MKRTRINKQIRVSEVRLINKEGGQMGIVKIDQALALAEESELDLVEVSPMAIPPVCRIMDFGKYQFEKSKQKAAQRKKQRSIHLKEVKFRPGTGEGDYQVKLRKIIVFLKRGDRVKTSLRFKGREMQHQALGLELLNRIKRDLGDVAIEQEPKMEGRQMTMVVMKGKNESNKHKSENYAEIKNKSWSCKAI